MFAQKEQCSLNVLSSSPVFKFASFVYKKSSLGVLSSSPVLFSLSLSHAFHNLVREQNHVTHVGNMEK